MIKLTLTPQSQPINYFFEKDTVILGKIAPGAVTPDLPLMLEGLTASHVKIEEIDEHFYAFNLTNDPNTTLNDKPFSKKRIHNGDILTIHHFQLQFEGSPAYAKVVEIENPPREQEVDLFDDSLQNLLQRKIDEVGSKPLKASQPFSDEDLNIQALLQRVNALEAAFLAADEITIENEDVVLAVHSQHALSTSIHALSSAKSPLHSPQLHTLPIEPETVIEESVQDYVKEKAPSPSFARQSLKDDYLKHLDDDNDDSFNKKRYKELSAPRVVISWKTLTTLVAGLMLFVCGAFSIFYVSVTDRSQKEELKVAAAVADIAMALNFAQINRALPQNQNWSDPDFLKHNVLAVLAKGYAPLANIDAHGQFVDTSYILRIYTSSDLTHFLIMAQPNANLLQWLAPKATIVVDSERMELRKSTDLRVLNRLLVDQTLDGANTREVSQFVSQGELIPLAELLKAQKNTGFSTPKALAFIHQGAEDYIYNAVRFYPFGESLTKKVIALYKARDNELDSGLLVQEINALQKLSNMILYTSGGLQSALFAQKALASFAPQHKFLLGYLQFNASGQVHSSHLLIDDSNTTEVAALDRQPLHNHDHAGEIDSTNTTEWDEEHAYESLLARLYNKRANDLQQIEKKIDHLIDTEIYTSIPHFSKRLQQLRLQYDQVNESHLQKIVQVLALISIAEHEEDKSRTLDNQDNALSRFSHLDLKTGYGLQPLVLASLVPARQFTPAEKFGSNEFTAHIDSIRKADSLNLLENVSSRLNSLMTKQKIQDSEELIAYQNDFRSEIMEKLDYLLFSPDQPLSVNELQNENRLLVAEILKNAGVEDEEEFDYYLNEFDFLCIPEHHLGHHSQYN